MSTLKIKNILVPTDFSDISIKAAEFAAGLCQKIKANLHLVNIVELTALVSPHQMMVSAHINEEKIKVSKTRLQDLTNDIKTRHNIHIRKNTYTGATYDGIIRAAHLLDIDLIIIGSNGFDSLGDKLFGSNTSKLISNTTLPILTINGDTILETNFKKILLPFNDDLITLKKIDYISFLAQLTDSEVIIYGFTTHANVEKTQKQIDKVSKQLDKKKLKSRSIVEQGEDYQSAVLAISKKEKPDLVSVICTHSTPIFSLFNADDNNRIVNNANTPVLSIPIFENL